MLFCKRNVAETGDKGEVLNMPYVIQTQFSVLNVYLPVNFSFAHMTEYLFEYDELEDLESDSICRFDVPTYMNDLFE